MHKCIVAPMSTYWSWGVPSCVRSHSSYRVPVMMKSTLALVPHHINRQVVVITSDAVNIQLYLSDAYCTRSTNMRYDASISSGHPAKSTPMLIDPAMGLVKSHPPSRHIAPSSVRIC